MMLEARLQKLRDFTQQRGFRRYRKSIEDSLVKYFRVNKFSFEKRSAHLLKFMCEHEDPIVFPEEKITFTRTCINIPQWFKNSDLKKQLNKKKGDEFWSTGNVCPDYEILLSQGLGNIREKICGLLQKNKDRKKKDFWEAVIISIDAVLDLARRYAICADAEGYDIEDARNYTVAACWEFIIPGKGMEIVNQGALSFPYAVDAAFRKTMHFPYLFSMKRLKNNIRQNMKEQIVNILKNRNVRMLPAPFLSIFFDGAVDAGKDAVYSAKYRNVGIHGAGSANGADALTVIKTYAERKDIAGLKELLKAKKQNFEHQEELRRQLADIMPKTGNDNDFVDSELKFLFDAYADCCDALSNKKRRIRPGSGTAMYYLWLTDTNNRFIIEPIVKATVDGRKKGDPLSTSLAPAHGVKVDGILSVLKSFSKIDYSRVMNGGPITVELTPSVFSSQDGIKKTAQLIRYFVMLGNQQLQLNVLDVAQLEDAVKHPERHRNLIVRVWGWSGYFCELAPEYQQHVINRHKYAI